MFTWSYSALKDYVNCPKQYQEVKVLKNYQKSMTQQILYGNQVHKALENYIKDGEPLAENYKRFEKLMDTLKEIPGEFHPELRMAINYEKQACKWSAEDCWAYLSITSSPKPSIKKSTSRPLGDSPAAISSRASITPSPATIAGKIW